MTSSFVLALTALKPNNSLSLSTAALKFEPPKKATIEPKAEPFKNTLLCICFLLRIEIKTMKV